MVVEHRGIFTFHYEVVVDVLWYHGIFVCLFFYFRLAELKKESGNQLYKTKKYQQAIPFYSEAIGICLTAVHLSFCLLLRPTFMTSFIALWLV
jgi:hypothetical protein